MSAKLPPGYRFDAMAGRYRNDRGRFVSTKTVYALMGSLQDAQVGTLRNLATLLAEQEIPAPVWYTATAQQIARLHVQFAALGAGGVDRLTSKQFGAIDRAVRDDMARLLRFGQAITEGNLSADQLASRLDMYIGSARRHYWACLPALSRQAGETVIERRRLGDADHCAWCVFLAQAGWQPAGVLPLPGDTAAGWTEGQCLSHCHCELEQRVVSYLEAKELLESALPAQYHRR